jgi:DNA modification methylase
LEPIPCRVLDPFSGAGTTSLVCERLGLDSIGIDTSVEYIKLAEARIVEDEQKRIGDQIKQLKEEAKLEFKTD